ncbi:MAG: hypothetical protein KC435_13745 [Thermomicrobiales bacterium]|nr:hypothetical protein [Thermomicrobiales bacterium]
MQPYKRKRRTRRDMITLGGWLFADLLLGLSLLFLVANTVSNDPPAPTPTPMPDYFATAESEIASNQLENQQTVVALESDLADKENQLDNAQATTDAEATRQARDADESVAAQATIAALSTEQAANAASQDELNSAYATTVAEATNVASQLQASGTEQAELRAAATENAAHGNDAEGTIAVLNTTAANAQATTDAAVATSDAANNEILAAQQQAQLNTLDPNAIPETLQVDLNGVIAGDEDALADARDELHRVLDPYADSETCRIGFVLISSRAPELGQGIQLSDAIAAMIPDEFPDLLPTSSDGGSPTLASESIALPGTTPTGEVQLLLFMSAGCEPTGQTNDLAPIAIYIREAR